VTRCSLSLKIVVDSSNLAIGLLCQIAVREDITIAVVKKGVGIDVA